jgi:hypothetical protein
LLRTGALHLAPRPGRDSVLWWSFSTFARNRVKFAWLQRDPAYAHLQWVEITRPAQAREFIERLARSA